MRLIRVYFARIQIKVVRRLFAAGTALSPPGLSVVILVTRPAATLRSANIAAGLPYATTSPRATNKSSAIACLCYARVESGRGLLCFFGRRVLVFPQIVRSFVVFLGMFNFVGL
jgi:hypothetical protein